MLALALGLRVAEVQRSAYSPVGDAHSYLVLGGQIAQTGDYSSLDRGAGGSRGPTAYFPPAFPYLLGAIDRVTGNAPTGAHEVHVARIVQAVIGTAIVGLVGLVAFELFGSGLALVAMAMAAVYPPFVELSAVLVAETLMVVFVLGAVWCALRARRTRDPLPWVVASGVGTGLATLAHVNAILIVIPLAVAIAQMAPVFGRRQLSGITVLLVSTLLTLTPWLVRDGVVLHTFVPISDESGITLAGTYNATSAHGHPPYRWLYFGRIRSDADLRIQAPRLSEPQLDAKLTNRAFSYVAHHPAAPLAAGYHNTLRLLELEGGQAWRASTASIGIPGGLAEIGVIGFWVLGVLAVIGVLPVRSGWGVSPWRVPGWVWAIPVLMWLSVVLVDAETPRFREAIDAFLILLATRGLAQLAGPANRLAARAGLRGTIRRLSWRFASPA